VALGDCAHFLCRLHRGKEKNSYDGIGCRAEEDVRVSTPWFHGLGVRIVREGAPFTRPQREWAIGTFLWLIWKKRMKELFAHPKYTFVAADCDLELRTLLWLRPPVGR